MPLFKPSVPAYTGPVGATANGAPAPYEVHPAGGPTRQQLATQPAPGVAPSGVHNPAHMNAAGTTTTNNGSTIPASGGTRYRKARGSGGKVFVGKLEHTAGTLLCSSALKARGIQKEREGKAVKVQQAELSTAERLEREAAICRERAVVHGASPEVLHPGNTEYNTVPQPLKPQVNQQPFVHQQAGQDGRMDMKGQSQPVGGFNGRNIPPSVGTHNTPIAHLPQRGGGSRVPAY